MGFFSGSETFKSLEHRNFRLYFFAQMLSLMGSWMQMTAQSWLLWRLTGSELLLGFLGFAQMGPVLLFGIFGGLVADRLPRKKLLLFTQSMALIQAATLAFLAFTGLITPVHILVLAALLGTINAFDMTARQTFLGDMVGMSDVGNAIALNSFLFNMARVVAPPVAGIIVSLYGEGPCFAMNAASFLFVLLALVLMDVGGRSGGSGSTIIASLREAVSFVRREPTTFRLILLLCVTSLALLPYAYFLPYFADKVLGGKAEMLGTLLASAGLGALVGALLMARKREVSGLPWVMGVSSLLLSADLALFSLSRSQVLSSILLFCAGLCTMLAASSANIFLQTTAPERLRGRIISFYVTTFVGFPPLGGFFIGNLAERFGTGKVLLWCALATAAASLLYLAVTGRKKVQPSGL
ncbi:MAG TPA: MFS transporter [Acidobacteriota bacterium]|nr:MFS transporter [Acidobacteriota bacterium]HQO20659.1 MFS transporter [Acidobacteriota bacterium]HQQ47527.1 MFS transporter [Acidobacteriota bacterium]